MGDSATMAMQRERLHFKILRIIEGEAEGQFAISALVRLVAFALLFVWLVKMNG